MARGFIGILTFVLVVVGALNWGLVGAFNFDLVQFILGSMPALANTVYILVGVSALAQVVMAFTCCESFKK